MTTKAQVTKEKIHWTLSKSKTFASKGIIKKVRRQVTECKKILSNHVSEKKLYQEHIKSSYNSIKRQKKFKNP